MHLYPPTRLAATNSHDGVAELTPADLDPATHPIICRHIFGIEPFCPIGLIADRIVQRLVSVQEARHAP